MTNTTQRPIKSAKTFREGGYYRWRIIDSHGREYLDGGNYTTREQAYKGLRAACAAMRASAAIAKAEGAQ
jgi:hypothetical protein